MGCFIIWILHRDPIFGGERLLVVISLILLIAFPEHVALALLPFLHTKLNPRVPLLIHLFSVRKLIINGLTAVEVRIVSDDLVLLALDHIPLILFLQESVFGLVHNLRILHIEEQVAHNVITMAIFL